MEAKMYDRKCADLARHFLADDGLDSDANVDHLAKRIQWEIEVELDAMKARKRPPPINAGEDTQDSITND